MPFWQRMYGVSLRISWGQCSAKALHKKQPKPQGCVGAASINHVRCTPQATALDDLVLRLKSQTMTMETQSCDLQSREAILVSIHTSAGPHFSTSVKSAAVAGLADCAAAHVPLGNGALHGCGNTNVLNMTPTACSQVSSCVS